MTALTRSQQRGARSPVRRVTRTPRPNSVVGYHAPHEVKPEVFIGLDPSLTGYGVVFYNARTQEHTELLLSTKADQDVYAYRLREIEDTLTEAMMPFREKVGAICMERAAYAASGAFTGGLVHAVSALALLRVFEGTALVKPHLVATNTLKKFVTGSGRGAKQLMVKYVDKKWGFDTDNDNLADAYGLARLAAAVASGTSELAYERECIATVLKRSTPSWKPPQPR